MLKLKTYKLNYLKVNTLTNMVNWKLFQEN